MGINPDPYPVQPDTEYHPLLGWDLRANLNSECSKTDNHKGQISNTEFDNTSTKILFFGDSYTQSVACSNNTLPAKLEKEAGIDTINFGVGGYGFDQIFLKLNSTYKEFNESFYCWHRLGNIKKLGLFQRSRFVQYEHRPLA